MKARKDDLLNGEDSSQKKKRRSMKKIKIFLIIFRRSFLSEILKIMKGRNI